MPLVWTIPLLALAIALISNAFQSQLSKASARETVERTKFLKVQMTPLQEIAFREELHARAMLDSDRIQLLTVLIGTLPAFLLLGNLSFDFRSILIGIYVGGVVILLGWTQRWTVDTNRPRRVLLGLRPLFFVIALSIAIAVIVSFVTYVPV